MDLNTDQKELITTTDGYKYMIYKNDCISTCLKTYDSFSPTEILFLSTLIDENDNIIEIGTNLGSHCIPLSKKNRLGKYFCFEPQIDIFKMLVTNITLNECDNVIPYNYGISDKFSLIPYSTSKINKKNRGGFRINTDIFSTNNDTFLKLQPISYFSELFTLESVKLIKIDVEGFEILVVNSLRDLIAKFKPIIFVEYEHNTFSELCKILKNMDYHLYYFNTSRNQYNKYKGIPDNDTRFCDINIVCFPNRLDNITYLTEIKNELIPRYDVVVDIDTQIKNNNTYTRKIVGFPIDFMSERGGTVATYDYAVANEEICGNKSIIFYQSSHPQNNPIVTEKFKKKFKNLISYDNYRDVEKYIISLNIDYLYILKYGFEDKYSFPLPLRESNIKIPYLIHSIFVWSPHGVYASVSKQIAEENKGNWLPHIVNPLPFSTNGREEFRKKHGIPNNAYVYGRHGGIYQFSIEYVKEIIKEDIDNYPNVWFVFVNTERFIDHPRVLFLPIIIDNLEKGNYINACDAMIHARLEGETFGLAVAEFISLGKPVLTCPAVTSRDNEHINLGKDWVTVFTNKEECRKMLWNTLKVPNTENPYLEFSPEKVMQKFGKILGDESSFMRK